MPLKRNVGRLTVSFRLMDTRQNTNNPLTRYWFKVPGLVGFGVTAFSLDDAFFLLEAEGYLIDRRTEVVVDIDVSTLDANHVLPNAGPASFRGVWFPCNNIGWVEPGVHHPLRGGNVKPGPPFVCGISVGNEDDSGSS